jgi:cytidylate kinase
LSWPTRRCAPAAGRWKALARGEPADEAAVLADILKRDERDKNRAAAPLKAAADAIFSTIQISISRAAFRLPSPSWKPFALVG